MNTWAPGADARWESATAPKWIPLGSASVFFRRSTKWVLVLLDLLLAHKKRGALNKGTHPHEARLQYASRSSTRAVRIRVPEFVL